MKYVLEANNRLQEQAKVSVQTITCSSYMCIQHSRGYSGVWTC